MKRGRRWLIGPLLLLAVGFVALNALAYSHARAMMRFTGGGPQTVKPERLGLAAKVKVLVTGVNIPRPEDDRPPTVLAPDATRLAIPVPDGVMLDAWHSDCGAAAPLVILFHGYATQKSSLLKEARAIHELGASVLLVDFRGSGGSSESYTTVGVLEAEDAAAAVRYARAHLPHTALVLFGQSMGAVAILRAVREHGIAPDGVILEAVFDTMLNTARNRFHAMRVPSFPSAELLVFWGGVQWGFNAFRHRPVEYARALTCPALFMHGTDDPRATLAEGRRVFEAVAGPREFKAFPDTGHESCLNAQPERWRQAVREFIVQVAGTAFGKDD